MLITITAKEGNKIVEQFDVELPGWANWIAQDKEGRWTFYQKKPVISGIFYCWIISFGRTKFSIFKIGRPNPDWRDTLIKVDSIT